MYKKYCILYCLTFVGFLNAQHMVSGYVYGLENNIETPLEGASVYWENSSTGVTTDDKGFFSLKHTNESAVLVVSYLSFSTVRVTPEFGVINRVELIPSESSTLDEVTITKKRAALQRSIFSSRNMTTIGSDELLKAACCNLSESFETNPSIDVNYSDALTGTKQIQMLGLTSPYILFTLENIPNLRGSTQTYGLSFTPGTWIESIQITKGAGSVTNGFESLSGQVNTELLKPLVAPRFFVNGYRSLNGRTELNLQGKHTFSKKWATSLFVHANQRTQKTDNNKDGFLDMPLSNQLNLLNRWQYIDAEKGWVGFMSLRYLTDQKQVGQLEFNPDKHQNGTDYWGGEIKTESYDFALKTGYVFPQRPYSSFGFQAALSQYRQDAYFGTRVYDVVYSSLFNHLVYQSIIGSTQHKFKTGLQYTVDLYDEQLELHDINRSEYNFGGFFEYSYDSLEQFNMILGLRIDHHNLLGTFVTPRAHLRYSFFDNTTILRLSAGEGRRVSSIFSEHQKFLGSQRQLNIAQPQKPLYGLLPERAWNYGFSWIQKSILFDRPIEFALDVYRTEFTNRVVVDWETPTELSFYNLNGKSFAQSFQLSANASLNERLDFRFAFKSYDVKTTYNSGLKRVPLQPKTRWFANMGYTSTLSSGRLWRADATFHRIGAQRRVASLSAASKSAPGFSLLSTQLTRQFSKNLSVYTGGENLLNIKQNDAVLGSNDPFGPSFDTSQVYAPVFGRMFYIGFRFNL